MVTRSRTSARSPRSTHARAPSNLFSGLGQRRGIVYTLCILFLAAVLLEMLAYQAEWAGRRTLDVQAPSDIDVLGYRLDELTWITQQSLGFNGTLSRNLTTVTLNISDEGFPLINNTNGSIDAGQLKTWLENNWTNFTHTSLTFNVTAINDTSNPVYNSELLQTTSGLNYSHINFYAASDYANLTIPPTWIPANASVTLNCSRPANTTLITYTNWAAAGSGLNGTVTYSDPALAEPYVNSVNFAPGNTNNFAAQYSDASSNWLQTIHVDWVQPNYTLLVWDESNSSYSPPFNKWNVSCSWNLSLVSAVSNASADSLYIPVNTSLGYNNASYSGLLTIARD